MKNINKEDRELYELFSMYYENGLLGFYELFDACENEECKSILNEVYKEKTGNNLKKEMLEDVYYEDLPVLKIGSGAFMLSDKQLSLLQSIMWSSNYSLFYNQDIDINKKFDVELKRFFKWSIDSVIDSIEREINLRNDTTKKLIYSPCNYKNNDNI